MFDVAPSELLIVAIVALVVIGPKDLPKAMRFVGQWVGKARGMARHFRSGLDTMMREAELEEMEKKWRDHNAAIMAAHPTLIADPAAANPAAAPIVDTAPLPIGPNFPTAAPVDPAPVAMPAPDAAADAAADVAANRG